MKLTSARVLGVCGLAASLLAAYAGLGNPWALTASGVVMGVANAYALWRG